MVTCALLLKPALLTVKPFALILLLLLVLQEVVQKLQHENEALKQQLKHPKQQQQQARGSHDSSSASTHVNGISSSSSRGVSRSGIVDLNVAGTVMTTSITALQQVRGMLGARGLWPDCVRQSQCFMCHPVVVAYMSTCNLHPLPRYAC
jgi:hypothetical protein